MNEKISILGFPIDNLSMDDAMERFDDLMKQDGMSLVVTANPEILNNALKNKLLAEVIRSADLVTADGITLVKVSAAKGQAFKERVTGIDFAYGAMKRCAALGKKVYLLGGKSGVAEAALKNLEKEIPGLLIAGQRDGYFTLDEEKSVVDEINKSGADFICVGTGSPKQELFLYRNKNSLLASVGVGIGGSLDVWSGNTKRAPQFYIDHGVEWLYRLVTEPKRILRMIKIPFFMLKALSHKE